MPMMPMTETAPMPTSPQPLIVSTGFSQSAEIGELVTALCKARPQFGQVEKNKEGEVKGRSKKTGETYSYTYRYADLAAAVAATSIPLAEQGLNVFQGFAEQDERSATTVSTLVHGPSGQWISTRVRIECAPDPQSVGGALTYGRRYSYLAVLGLAPEEDHDGADVRPPGSSRTDNRSEREYPSAKAARQVRELAEKGDAADAWKAVAAAIKSLDDGKGGMLRPDKITALFTAAQKNGWSKEDVLAKLKDVANVNTAQIPWKAGDAVLAAFESIAPSGEAQTKTAKREPIWEDWEIIKAKIGEIDSDAPNCERQELLDHVAQASGWPSTATTRVLREELGLAPDEIPKDRIPYIIGRLLSAFNPQDILPSYDAKENPPDEPDEPSSSEEEPGVDPALISKAIAPLKTKAFPGSDEEAAVALFIKAVEKLSKLGDLPMITDRSAFDNPERTGNRDRAGVVDALADIGFEPGDCPLVLQGPLLQMLSAFPIAESETEESEDA